VTDGSYTCSEDSMTYRDVESLCCAPETNVTLCVSCTQKTITKPKIANMPGQIKYFLAQ